MIVLDCSAAVEMVRRTTKGDAFRGLVLSHETVVTSDLFRIEVRNALWQYVRAGLLPVGHAEAMIATALELADEFVPLEENAAESFAEAVRQNHPVYDLLYATLARRKAATLLTADKKLAALCEAMGIQCVHEVDL